MTRKLSGLTPLEIKGNDTKPTLIAASPVISIRQALKTMSIHNITSLPIYSHDSKNIVNIVNFVDVLYYVTEKVVAGENLPNHLKDSKLDDHIEAVMTLDTERESYRILKTDANDNIKSLLEAFSRGIHRSLVIDYTNKTEPYILTQTDIIRYVYAHPESLPSIDFDSSLKSLGLAEKKHEVVVGYDNEIALNLYRRMSEKNLTGIPIINSEEKLIGNLSVSDLRGLSYESIENLALPVLKFLETLSNSETSLNAISVSEHASLREVLRLIVTNRIHRVWIVSEDCKVRGIVSLTDLIQLFS
ncbi:4992_t:CDS:2 [Acaulospora morrowiae]|uniref:4992_t:CDS:1 n=1 Tax=Acaulospora morrowiae TaxID=94023 RepID=A0A9N9FFC2_9GLOM|nr:4992_t:CDS:2 [Acaulospora morrowiae]